MKKVKLNAFWKGLIMAIVGFLAATIGEAGEVLNWAYIGIATGGFTIIYIAKNAIFPSVSLFNKWDLQDILSGLVLAVGMAVSSGAAAILTTGSVDWSSLWKAVVGAVVGYFLKTLKQGIKT